MNVLQLNIIVLVIASETVEVFGARRRCPAVRIANGNAQTRSRGRIITYKCYRGYTMLGEEFAACVRGKWDPDPPVCIKPGCAPVRNFKNGHITQRMRSALLEFSCNPGYKLVGPSFIYCDGRKWNTLPPFCKAADISCNFENETPCNWNIETHDDDDFMWHIQQLEPPSRILGTGPKNDHTFSNKETGHYLMIETSDYDSGSSLIPARIHSPKFPVPSDNNTCFIFWYHMFGGTVGVLNVFLNNKVVFQEMGNHGDRWIKGVVPLTNNGPDLQIMIEGTHGGGMTGVIGLDDFLIGLGSDCEYSKVKSCEGSCNKNISATDTCLCSQECFVDSSCCEDYDQFCGSDATASTVLELGYETELSESFGTEEGETLSTEIIPTDSSNIHLGSDISSYDFVKDRHVTYSTDSVSESFNVSSTLLTSNDGKINSNELTTQLTTLSTKEFNINSGTTAHIQESFKTPQYTKGTEKDSVITENKITLPVNPTLFLIPTNKLTTQVHTLKSFEVVNKSQTISNQISKTSKPLMFVTNNQTITPKMIRNKTSKPSNPLEVTKFLTTPMVINKTRITNKPSDIPKLNKFTQLKITNRASKTTHISRNTVTVKPTLNTTFQPQMKSSNSSLSIKSHALTNVQFPTTKAIGLSHVALTVHKQKTATATISPFILYSNNSKSTLRRQTSTNLQLTTKPTKQTSDFPLHVLQNLTSKISFINPETTKTLGIRFASTPFQKITKKWAAGHKTSKEMYNKATTVKLSISTQTNKIKTTSAPKNFVTKEIVKPSNSSIIKYTVQPLKSVSTEKPIEQPNSKLSEKWHPDNTTKEKYQLNAEETNYSNPISKEIIISSVCLATLLIIGIVIPFYIIRRRRRLRFVNDCEGDVLYTSSEEMLDLHLARPVVI
uniref:ClassC scavenger receptor n=1 Tax=Riptortus pedestris TaxID=329032 RepID=R4WE00_RIPPE|nr:classC scavenger receptor [Riptortus pedestris]